jgi:1,2-diacylglycerol 3-alpha-glucosyltransferase
MRIGMMADVYRTHVSGVTNSIALMKEWLEKHGHEVYVFTFGDEGRSSDEKNIIITPGVPLVDTGFYFNLRYNRNARRLLYTMDIAHVHHPFLSGSLAMRYCVPRNIPVVFTNHTRYDLYAQAYLPILPVQIEEAALKAYLSPFFKACDLVVVPSPSMRSVLEEHYGLASNIEIIPHGVDLTPYRAHPKPIERSVFGFSPDDIILTNVGRLAPEKNLAMLLRAFHGVLSIDKRLRLLLVGDGPERENLEDRARYMQISDKVHITGMVDYQDVPTYLAACDIFVTPSRTETFGLSTVEAMAAGLPVVGVDAPGTSDLIDDGVNGLISSDDVAVFTAKLILLTTNHELRKKLGDQARLASEKYDIQNTSKILEEHYQQLVEAARRRMGNPRYRVTRIMDKFV